MSERVAIVGARRLVVAGSRDLTSDDYPIVADAIDRWLREHGYPDVVIVEGGSRGADALAAQYCRVRLVAHRRENAGWSSSFSANAASGDPSRIRTQKRPRRSEADAWGSRPLPIPALDLDAPLVDPPGRRSDLACRGVAHAAHAAR